MTLPRTVGLCHLYSYISDFQPRLLQYTLSEAVFEYGSETKTGIGCRVGGAYDGTYDTYIAPVIQATSMFTVGLILEGRGG